LSAWFLKRSDALLTRNAHLQLNIYCSDCLPDPNNKDLVARRRASNTKRSFATHALLFGLPAAPKQTVRIAKQSDAAPALGVKILALYTKHETRNTRNTKHRVTWRMAIVAWRFWFHNTRNTTHETRNTKHETQNTKNETRNTAGRGEWPS
jgi:hypothetical protein